MKIKDCCRAIRVQACAIILTKGTILKGYDSTKHKVVEVMVTDHCQDWNFVKVKEPNNYIKRNGYETNKTSTYQKNKRTVKKD